jgi:uncharacterized membrane-anchored protein
MAPKELKTLVVFALAVLLFATSGAAQEQSQSSQEPKVKIDWQRGPTTARVGDIAEIKVPEGYRFTGQEGAHQVMLLTHNIPSGKELGVLVPNQASWFLIFEFHDTGYVKDEDKDKLDSGAPALLKSIQDATEESNAERSKHGWKAFHVTGWEHTPYYDPQTHNLTWAIRGRGDDPGDAGSVNHSIRLLGRYGRMDVDLVADPGEYQASIAEVNTLISGFSYNGGNRYSDFRPGDKVAKYGLTALIAGGAGAVLLKTGLLAKLWKFILVAILAIAGAIKKFFASIFGSKEDKIEDPNKQAAAQG